MGTAAVEAGFVVRFGSTFGGLCYLINGLFREILGRLQLVCNYDQKSPNSKELESTSKNRISKKKCPDRCRWTCRVVYYLPVVLELEFEASLARPPLKSIFGESTPTWIFNLKHGNINCYSGTGTLAPAEHPLNSAKPNFRFWCCNLVVIAF